MPSDQRAITVGEPGELWLPVSDTASIAAYLISCLRVGHGLGLSDIICPAGGSAAAAAGARRRHSKAQSRVPVRLQTTTRLRSLAMTAVALLQTHRKRRRTVTAARQRVHCDGNAAAAVPPAARLPFLQQRGAAV